MKGLRISLYVGPSHAGTSAIFKCEDTHGVLRGPLLLGCGHPRAGAGRCLAYCRANPWRLAPLWARGRSRRQLSAGRGAGPPARGGRRANACRRPGPPLRRGGGAAGSACDGKAAGRGARGGAGGAERGGKTGPLNGAAGPGVGKAWRRAGAAEAICGVAGRA